MIRTVRELLDEIENQVGDHDESEVPVEAFVQEPTGVPNHYTAQRSVVASIEFFNGSLAIYVEET